LYVLKGRIFCLSVKGASGGGEEEGDFEISKILP
jgi:hypothetical protein